MVFLMALIDEDYLRISLRSEAFRITFEEPFRAVFGLALIGATSWFLLQGITQYVILGLIVPVTTGIMAAVGVEILRRQYQFQIAPQGLSCYDFWGRRKTIPWSSMRTVRRFSLFGLSYLRISADQLRSDIWLPLFVERDDILTDLIGAHVDESHPLAIQLKLARAE
jgi:hypothetical protein